MQTQTINISIPKKLLTAIDKRAKKEIRTRSELLREATRVYLRRTATWDNIFKYGRKKAKELGIKSEEEVYRIVDEFRHGR